MKTTKLKKLCACPDAIEYVRNQKTYLSAWANCERGDWMLWIASKLKINKRLLILAKGECAATVLHLMKDQRSKDAVKAAIDYGKGIINKAELDAAAAAYAAAADAADAAAYAAARKQNQRSTAEICRRLLSIEVLKRYKNLKV